MEALLLSVVTTLFCMAVTALLALRYRIIFWPIIIGGAFRLVLAWVIGLDLVEIPGTTNDAREFERLAREWAELDWGGVLQQFDPSRSYVISFFGAVVYKITWPSPVVLNLINAVASIFLIYYTYRVASELWGDSRAVGAAWIVSLFPFAVLYGSVYRREVFGSLLFMLGILKAIRWVRTNNPISFASSLVFFAFAALLHSGYAFGAAGLLVFALASMFFILLKGSKPKDTNFLISSAIAVVVGVVAVVMVFASGANINKLGSVDTLDVRGAIEYRVAERASEGGSLYPRPLVQVDPFANPLVIPGRFVYFLMSPFPWDIKAISHILGLIATLYFLLIIRSIFFGRSCIFRNKEALVVLLITLSAVLVFAVSIDNIGTSIRHRTKFIYPLAALCVVPLFRKMSVRGRSRRIW